MTIHMKPGPYMLIRDVINPHRDKRRSRDWSENEVWPKGTIIFVGFETFEAAGRSVKTNPFMYPHGEYRFKRIAESTEPERWYVLSAALQPLSDERWKLRYEFAEEHDEDMLNSLVEELLTMGKLTPDDVRAARLHYIERLRSEEP